VDTERGQPQVDRPLGSAVQVPAVQVLAARAREEHVSRMAALATLTVAMQAAHQVMAMRAMAALEQEAAV
jgi:hypothetical protein